MNTLDPRLPGNRKPASAAISGSGTRPACPDFHRRWSTLTAPQRPGPEVVAAMRPFFADRHGPALQLGVTPEIAQLSGYGVAVDWDAEMIRVAWPGDSATHRARLGNWLALPLDDGCMDMVFGDGCLSMLGWPDEHHALLGEVERVLRPGGRLLLRCFAGPDNGETVEALAHASFAGIIPDFATFKLRLNMAAYRRADGVPNTGKHIHDVFEATFPDRDRLASATGWQRAQIDSIDAYAGAGSVHSYPTRRDIGSVLPPAARCRFVETSGYSLAEWCPLLVLDF